VSDNVIQLGAVRADKTGDAADITPLECLRDFIQRIERGELTADQVMIVAMNTTPEGLLQYDWSCAKMHARDMIVACELVKHDAIGAFG
jgi:hypothetical protein